MLLLYNTYTSTRCSRLHDIVIVIIYPIIYIRLNRVLIHYSVSSFTYLLKKQIRYMDNNAFLNCYDTSQWIFIKVPFEVTFRYVITYDIFLFNKSTYTYIFYYWITNALSIITSFLVLFRDAPPVIIISCGASLKSILSTCLFLIFRSECTKIHMKYWQTASLTYVRNGRNIV